jgi:hypothetical protein
MHRQAVVTSGAEQIRTGSIALRAIGRLRRFSDACFGCLVDRAPHCSLIVPAMLVGNCNPASARVPNPRMKWQQHSLSPISYPSAPEVLQGTRRHPVRPRGDLHRALPGVPSADAGALPIIRHTTSANLSRRPLAVYRLTMWGADGAPRKASDMQDFLRFQSSR